MAEEDDNNESGDVQPDLASVQKLAKTNRLLLICVFILCAILASVVGTGLSVMFSRIDTLTQAAVEKEDDPMDEQFSGLEQQLIRLSEFRKRELRQINAFTKQLERTRSDCSIEKAAPYTDFLMSREDDFQKLIDSINEGTSSLAGMNKGSRKWVAPYVKSLGELKKRSVERKKKLKSMLAAQS